MRQLPSCVADYNEVHPHETLGYRLPREFIATRKAYDRVRSLAGYNRRRSQNRYGEVSEMRPMLVCIIAFAINAPSSALAQSTDALPTDIQHYGEIADPSVWPISAVGVVTVALFSRKIYCTGTLVAPKLVLTAAHCLFNGKLLVNSGNVRFLAGLNKGVPAAHADAKRLVVPKEFSPGAPSQDSVVNDWAVIVLSDTISSKPIPVRPTTRDELRTVVNPAFTMQVGYGRDRPLSAVRRSGLLRE
jgi:secreted trypsin-like serine protease